MTVPVQMTGGGLGATVWFVVTLAALVWFATRRQSEMPRWMGVSADLWVVVVIAFIVWLGATLDAQPISCTCPFKDPNECWWWRLLYNC